MSNNITLNKRTFFSALLIVCLLSILFTSAFFSNAQSDITITENSFSETVSYVIWQSGSTYYIKNGATGETSTSTNITALLISTAITLDAAGGGDIILKEGVYYMSSNYILLWELSNINIIGEGAGTIITQNSANNGIHLIYLYNCTNCVIKNLEIYGAKTTQTGGTSAICIYGGAENRIEGCKIANMYNFGIALLGYTSFNWITNNFISGTDNNAITITNDATYSGYNTVHNNKIYFTGGFGVGLVYADRNTISTNSILKDSSQTYNEPINIDGSSYNTITNNQLIGSGDVGISIHATYAATTYSWGNKILENYIEGNAYHGIDMVNAKYTVISENTIINNNQDNETNYAGIYLHTSNTTNNIISNNIIFDTQTPATQHWGIYETDPSDYNIIQSNNCYNNLIGGIHFEGDHTEVTNCYNNTVYVTYGRNLNMTQHEITDFVVDTRNTAPANPVIGQMYYDIDDNVLYVWNNTAWHELCEPIGVGAEGGMTLHVDGNVTRNAANDIVILRGWNHASGVETDTFKWSSWEYFNQTIVQLTLDAYVSQGANVLRRHLIVESWLNNINCNTEEGTWTYKQCWEYILAEAETRGIYVIVDPAKVTQWLSGENDQMGFDPYAIDADILDTQTEFATFVGSIVETLGEHNNLIIEPWNEPFFSHTGDAYGLIWQSIYNEVIAEIREVESVNSYNTHLILCCLKAGLQYWDLTDEIANFNWLAGYPLTDSESNLIYGLHAYRSYGSVGGSVYPFDDAPYDYATIKAIYIEEGLLTAANSVPIFIGEIGCLANANDASWMNATLTIFNEWGIGYAGWTWRQDGGQYAMVTTDTEPVTGGTLNSYGQIVADAIAAG